MTSVSHKDLPALFGDGRSLAGVFGNVFSPEKQDPQDFVQLLEMVFVEYRASRVIGA